MIDRSEQDKRNGIVRHTLVSSNAPNKVADISTEDGRQNIINRITKLEGVFIDYVALGRNTTAENVMKNFGQGGMLIASEALEVGMIDDIISVLPQTRNTTSSENTEINEGENKVADITMSEEQLNKLVTDTATKAVDGATANFKVSLAERDAKSTAETERKQGFTDLKAIYPNQASMIDEECKKEGATVNMAFIKKCAEAETARLSAEDELKKNAGDKVIDGAKPKVEDNTEATATVTALAGQLGVDIQGVN